MDPENPEYRESDVSSGLPLPRTELDEQMQNLLHHVDEVVENQERVSLLLDVVVGLAADLSVNSVLERIVEAASRLVQAQYAALGVIGSDRDRRLREFITYGMTAEQREAIGDLPRGHGLLGLIIDEPRAVRTSEIAAHAKSYGFPPQHPPMHSFLGVPVRIRDKVFGNLYLTEKKGGLDFSERDEAIVTALAAAAGVVIENARLYEESARRERWLEATAEITAALLGNPGQERALQLTAERAREMAAADAGCIVLRTPDDRLELRVTSGPSQDLIGTKVSAQESLVGIVVTTGESVVVEDVRNDPRVSEDPLLKAGCPELAAVVLVPMQTSAGVEGALILGWSDEHSVAFTDLDVQQPQRFAVQAALGLQASRAREDRALLTLFEDRDRIGRDLHDLVIQRLFAIGLNLENSSRMLHQPEVAQRVASAVDDIDATIKDIRRSIFALSAAPDAADVRRQLADVIERAGESLTFTPSLRTEGPLNAGISAELAPHLIAVLGEALSNVARHAEASAATISVTVGDDVVLSIADNGVGLGDVKRRSGLRNLRERAEQLGGHLDVSSSPDGGTVLTWSVPSSGSQQSGLTS
ncbi:MAG: GAF domain-containing protein [Nocardioidaceae bacterium]